MIHEYEMRLVRRNARAQVRDLGYRLGLGDCVPEPEPLTTAEAMAGIEESITKVVRTIGRFADELGPLRETFDRLAETERTTRHLRRRPHLTVIEGGIG
jgi:hypothetical protein